MNPKLLVSSLVWGAAHIVHIVQNHVEPIKSAGYIVASILSVLNHGTNNYMFKRADRAAMTAGAMLDIAASEIAERVLIVSAVSCYLLAKVVGRDEPHLLSHALVSVAHFHRETT